MGWWSADIMGGDTPLDFKGMFEDTFGVADPEDWYGEGPAPEYRVPTSEEAEEFLNECQGLGWGGGDGNIAAQVAGFLVMERAAPMSDELRTRVLEGIDNEFSEGCGEWNDPEERKGELADFRQRVAAYPAAGGEVEMPETKGLFQKLAEHMAAGKSGLVNDNLGG